MKLATVKQNGREQAAVVAENRFLTIEAINQLSGSAWSEELLLLLQNGELKELGKWLEKSGTQMVLERGEAVETARFAPLYRQPEKVWGVGMNYMEKALELSGQPPSAEPVIFMKPNSSLIGPEDDIVIPPQSPDTAGEAELAIVIGKECRNVEEADFAEVVAGFTTSLDMTAKTIHSQNPSFLQRSKSFDTFCSFGPYLVTADELPPLENVRVETVLNGAVHHENIIANMMYQPAFIVSFFSKIMTLQAGDVILTGTPGSVLLREGDVLECRVTGLPPLSNPVQ